MRDHGDETDKNPNFKFLGMHVFEPKVLGGFICKHCDQGSAHKLHLDEFDPRAIDARLEAAYDARYKKAGPVRKFVTTYSINLFNDHSEPITTKVEAVADTLFLMLIERGLQPVVTKQSRWKDI
jgi:hypothetical protein